MRINNNIMALNTHNFYTGNNQRVAKSAEKLSSGYRINRAGDDAAGLAISEKMRAQIKGLNMAKKNAQDAISLAQTAEGALQESHSILQRMRELAIQARSDTNDTTVDRDALDKEYQQLKQEINDTAQMTRFNGKKVIDGSFDSTTGGITIQIGANWNEELSINISSMGTTQLKIQATAVSTGELAKTAISALTLAINVVSTQRAAMGALSNRLEHKINNLTVSSENLSAAESRIRDVDMASEMTNFTKNNILSQAATAMLAQANQSPQGVLQLLQ